MSNKVLGAITLAILCSVVGCGGIKKTDVSGQLTYKGQKAAGCTVTLVGIDGIPHTETTTETGSFKILDVPVGAVKIGLVSVHSAQAAKARQASVGRANPNALSRTGDKGASAMPVAEETTPTSTVKIDPKYANPETSTLTGVVKEGEPLNIDVK